MRPESPGFGTLSCFQRRWLWQRILSLKVNLTPPEKHLFFADIEWLKFTSAAVIVYLGCVQCNVTLLLGVLLCRFETSNQRSVKQCFSIGVKLLFKDIKTWSKTCTCGGATGTDWLLGTTGTTSGWTTCIWGWTLCTREKTIAHVVKMRQRRK